MSHLKAQLEAAVDRAMALSPEQRKQMTAEALAKRFPAKEMMEAYAAAWDNIDATSAEVQASSMILNGLCTNRNDRKAVWYCIACRAAHARCFDMRALLLPLRWHEPVSWRP